jgi:hypothetical protein
VADKARWRLYVENGFASMAKRRRGVTGTASVGAAPSVGIPGSGDTPPAKVRTTRAQAAAAAALAPPPPTVGGSARRALWQDASLTETEKQVRGIFADADGIARRKVP